MVRFRTVGFLLAILLFAGIVSCNHQHVINKREAFIGEDIEEIVEKHNEIRRKIKASNMYDLKWSDRLALMADEWAEHCTARNGQPDKVNNREYDSIGQNIYATNRTFRPMEALYHWAKQKNFYDSKSGQCLGKESCSHFTQMVWANTKEIGCGFAKCDRVEGLELTQAHVFVCNYYPPGNWAGEQAYERGNPCSKCQSGQGWCSDSLCTDSCAGKNCECKARCYNCGTLDQGDCKCKCTDGWTGPTCQQECKDMSPYCGGTQTGWPVEKCNRDHQYVLDMCPKMCGLCNPMPANPAVCNWTVTAIPGPTLPPSTTPYYPERWKIPNFWQLTPYRPHIYVLAGVFGTASFVAVVGCIWCFTCRKYKNRNGQKKGHINEGYI